MSSFANVTLLATDGSREAGQAARMAVELSRSLGSELHAVYAEPLPRPYAFPESTVIDPAFGDEMRRRAEEEARAKLEEEVGKMREAGGDVAGSHASVGRPDAEIVRLAEEVGAGLVIVGSRGLGPIRRATMGSVPESVVRYAHCPVLVVREGRR